MEPSLILLLSRILFTGVASFLAIALWARMRDLPWMLVVVGTLLGYADIILSFLGLFGLVDLSGITWLGVEIIPIISANLPALLYATAFAIMIYRKRLR
jgi:hypothetical protein